MTGISERKSQWESEAIEANNKMIAEWLRRYGEGLVRDQNVIAEYVAGVIERGEYRKTEAGV